MISPFAVVRIQKRQFATIIWERFNGTNDTCLMFFFVRLTHSVDSRKCLYNEILSNPSLKFHSFFYEQVHFWLFLLLHSFPYQCLHELSSVMSLWHNLTIGSCFVNTISSVLSVCLKTIAFANTMKWPQNQELFLMTCSEWKNESIESPWWSDWTKKHLNGIWINNHVSLCLNLI